MIHSLQIPIYRLLRNLLSVYELAFSKNGETHSQTPTYRVKKVCEGLYQTTRTAFWFTNNLQSLQYLKSGFHMHMTTTITNKELRSTSAIIERTAYTRAVFN